MLPTHFVQGYIHIYYPIETYSLVHLLTDFVLCLIQEKKPLSEAIMPKAADWLQVQMRCICL